MQIAIRLVVLNIIDLDKILFTYHKSQKDVNKNGKAVGYVAVTATKQAIK